MLIFFLKNLIQTGKVQFIFCLTFPVFQENRINPIEFSEMCEKFANLIGFPNGGLKIVLALAVV